MLFLPLLLLFSSVIVSVCHAASFDRDPYQILGVTPDASQDEIRANYRKRCLLYHPDKNVGKHDKERQRCEEMFKQIQSANALIGDAESRRSYDMRSSFLPRKNAGGTRSRGYEFPRHRFREGSVDEFYRAFASAAAFNSRPRGSPDTFSRSDNPFFGFSSEDMFAGGRSSFGRPSSQFWNGGSLKSVYVQKVKVPLQDLYRGRNSMELRIRDTAWKRYCAAFRGGFGYLVLYQSLIFSAPVLRLSGWLALACSAFVFHLHVPKPSILQYTVDILPGYKEGTKITFRDAETGFDVVFLVEEEVHDRFKRVGDNLHTTVDILASQAKNGCAFEVQSLNPMEEPFLVNLRPNQIKQSGDTTVVKGRGWPIRKGSQHGDLVISFRIVRKLKRSRKKKR